MIYFFELGFNFFLKPRGFKRCSTVCKGGPPGGGGSNFQLSGPHVARGGSNFPRGTLVQNETVSFRKSKIQFCK